MSTACELLNRPPQPTLVIRTHSAVQDLAQAMGQAFGAVAQYLGQLGEHPAGPPYAAYHNMDMQNLDVEMGFPVARPLPGQGAIQPALIPGGQSVAGLHVGPYDQMHHVYEALTAWLKANGREATGVVYEVYLTDPNETAPEALQTQVLMPLR